MDVIPQPNQTQSHLNWDELRAVTQHGRGGGCHERRQSHRVRPVAQTGRKQGWPAAGGGGLATGHVSSGLEWESGVHGPMNAELAVQAADVAHRKRCHDAGP